MAKTENLPFEKGSTLWGGVAADISASGYDHLLGKEFQIEDTGTGALQTLRVVRQTSSNRFTTKLAYQYDNVAASIGRKIKDATTDGSQMAGVLDDDLSTTVAQNDICYIHVAGPVNWTKGTATNMAVREVCTPSLGGKFEVATATKAQVGIYDSAAKTTAVTTASRVWLGAEVVFGGSL
jgi:hypothetical protein